MSAKSEQRAKLEALECHFTWQIDEKAIPDSCQVEEDLSDRIKCGDKRNDVTYYHVLAYVRYLLGKTEAAKDHLSKAETILKERKDDMGLLVTYGNYAWLHYHCGNMEEVEVYLSKVADIEEANPIASERPCKLPLIHGEKGRSFRLLGARFYERAQESFEEAVAGDPDNKIYNFGLAEILFRLERIYEKEDEQRSRRVTSQLQKALDLDPANELIMVLLALKLQEGNKKAKKLIEKARPKAGDKPWVTRYIAMYFRAEGDVDESLRLLNEALEQARTPTNKSFINHQIGLCHKSDLIKMKDSGAPRKQITSKARECVNYFSEAVRLKPGNTSAQIKLAEAYAENDEKSRAEEIYSKVLESNFEIEVNRQSMLVSYGLFLMYHMMNESEAVKQLKAAYQIPVPGVNRDKARRKLSQLAKRFGGEEENRIQQFLQEEDKKMREKGEKGAASSSSMEKLHVDFGGLKLKPLTG